MNILFYDTKRYDMESFDAMKDQYDKLTIDYVDTDLSVKTARLAKGYDAICAFVSSDVSAPVVNALSDAGVKLILMRCAGFNNVDMDAAKKCGITVMRVPGYSPEAVAEHAMALAMAVNRRLHKSYIKVRENNFSLVGLTGMNFYGKTAGIVGTGKIGAAMAKAERILDELHVPFVINQNRYSILDRSVENNGLLKQTYTSGKGLICFSPLAQGMLTDRYLKDMPADSRAVKDGRFLHEDQVLETRPLLNQLNEIAAGYDMKLSELAIAWLLNKPEVTTVLIGASKPEQIISNLKAVEKQAHTVMTDDELQKIEDAVAAFERS